MFIRVLFILMILTALPACSPPTTYGEPPAESEVLSALPPEDPAPRQIGVPVIVREPGFTDPLTGLPAREPAVDCRPVAVAIDNHHQALPQSGISQAAICYEILAEGNITRIIAIFHDFNTQKIGPIRSVRSYFLNFAMDYDAIFVHHGGSPQGYDLIEESGIAALDAMRLSGTFWRDPERAGIPGMSVHSSYTGEALIRQAQERFKFRPVIREGLNPGFSFYDEPAQPDGAAGAAYVYVPFAAGYGSMFEYREDGLYYKYMEDEPQIDAETGEQLSVSNILIQYAPVYLIQGDTAGRREAVLTGAGDGVLITRGGWAPVRWGKQSLKTPTRWYNTDGGALYFNRGKTWICVVSPETAVKIE